QIYGEIYLKNSISLILSYHTSDLLQFLDKIEPSERIKYFQTIKVQLVNALNCLNSEGVLHGDIKPDNVLIDYSIDNKGFLIYEPKIYLADFGLSKQFTCDAEYRIYELDILYTDAYRPYELLLYVEDNLD